MLLRLDFTTETQRLHRAPLRIHWLLGSAEPTGATAGFPLANTAKRTLLRCFFKLKSRERQLINDRMPAVTNKLATPKAIAIPFPVGVRFRPAFIESIACIPCQPSRP